ncbi:MAG: hypothetical protein Q4D14_06655 [Bacteroidales bacterium]|nr:hypothetical protein [Bacteroidales bacterium]
MSKLLVFNPDHDLALASGTPNYTAPPNATVIANDLAHLLCWSNTNDVVVSNEKCVDAYRLLNGGCSTTSWKQLDVYEMVEPWGWNESIAHKLRREHVPTHLIPSESLLQEWRNNAHRRMAAKLAECLMNHDVLMPNPAIELFTIEDLEQFVNQHHQVVFKAPWSGSGRGLMWCNGELTPQVRNRCLKLLTTQGSVMGEVRQVVIQDFALEFFKPHDGNAMFKGYSVFNTSNGVYKQNIVGSQTYLESIVTRYVSKTLLSHIIEQSIEFINQNFPTYMGCLGIDMFIYECQGCIGINPAVEINLRNTMGNVALELANRWLDPQVVGTYSIDYYPNSHDLLNDHYLRSKTTPLEIKEGKIVGGYLSLCPINETTHYRARIDIVANRKGL